MALSSLSQDSKQRMAQKNFVVRGDRTCDLVLQAKICGSTCKWLLRLAFFRLISAPWYSGSLVGSPWGFSGRHFLWPGSNPAFLKGISIQTAPAPLLGLQHAANVPGNEIKVTENEMNATGKAMNILLKRISLPEFVEMNVLNVQHMLFVKVEVEMNVPVNEMNVSVYWMNLPVNAGVSATQNALNIPAFAEMNATENIKMTAPCNTIRRN